MLLLQVLGDEGKKSDYDMFGMSGGAARAGAGAGAAGQGPFQRQQAGSK